MRTKTKSILGLTLALAVAAMSIVTAFAATITVTNPVEGATYAVYKILNASPIPGSDGKYQYTIEESSPWFSTVSGAGNGITVHPAEGSSKVHTVTFDGNQEAAVTALIPALKAIAKDQTPETTLTVADGASVATGTVSDPGYYFVTTGIGALTNLLTVNDSVSIFDKNEWKFDKSLNYSDTDLHRDFAIGETVKFKVESLVPVSTGYDTYSYELVDTMPAEIDLLPDTIEIFVDGDKLTSNFEIPEKDARHFKATLDVKALNAANLAMKPVLFTYDGKVNDQAKFGAYENNAVMRHGPVAEFNDADKGTKWTESTDKEKIFNHKIVVDKMDQKDNSKLENAKFALVKEENGKAFFYNYDETAKAVNWVEIEGASTAKDAMTQKKADAMASSITVKTTDNDGAADFPGLRNGSYFLVETAAPAGYNALLEPVAVLAQADGGETSVYAHTATVKNIGGSTMPTTGGMGTTLFYIGGAVVLIAGIAFLAARKKAKED